MSVYGSGQLQQSTRLLSGYVATLPNVVSCTAVTRMHIKEYYNAKVELEIGSTAGATWLQPENRGKYIYTDCFTLQYSAYKQE